MSVRRDARSYGKKNQTSKTPETRHHDENVRRPSGKANITRREQEIPQTELEKLDCLRSKMEESVEAFIDARKKLAEILSADGSSEQQRVLNGSSAQLRAELQRHRELVSRLESSLKDHKDPKHPVKATVRMSSSYEFLKSITG